MLLTDMIDRRFLAAGSQHSAKGKEQRAKGKADHEASQLHGATRLHAYGPAKWRGGGHDGLPLHAAPHF
ncbi:hypothetical protein HYQ46_006524 [Verticillium longisporum]|nr:hypothetical protein HYQ46_006524 [Verticillium longisporum]